MAKAHQHADTLDQHYQKTLENLALVSGENLHFVGYFETPRDTLATALQNLNRLFQAKAGLDASDLVLDVGCGNGGPACYLAETAGCKVVGIDIGARQLERACRLVASKSLTSLVRFSRQDAARMAFEPGRFDVILIMGSASNITAKDDLVAECARVCKSAGRLVLGDAVMVDAEWFDDRQNAAKVKVFETFFGSPFLEPVDRYRHLLRRHGFKVLDVQDLAPHVLRSFELWSRVLLEHAAGLAEQLGDSRYRALTKGLDIITTIVREGRIGCVVITAVKGSALV
jgi:cyclopropane fatty-acyl-phospholipid synthase-like methyltransferase